MLQSEEGRKILKNEPIVTKDLVNRLKLSELPEKTFGHAYCKFISSNNFDPDQRPPVKFIEDPNIAYVVLRHRQIHDFLHVLFGLPPSVLGELVQKQIEGLSVGVVPSFLAGSFGLPIMTAIRLFNGKKPFKDTNLFKYYTIHMPYAVNQAQRLSKDLMSVYYEEYFEWDLNKVRQHLNIEPAQF